MSAAEALPNDIVAQFRATTVERLGRIEEAWGSLAHGVATAENESELFHDVHTLKGEARLVGFADVVLIIQRLEDLLVAARRRRYRVNEDVDVLVTMAIQFARMLVRKRPGASNGGIDIGGFLKQIEDVLAEWPRQSEGPESNGAASMRPADGGKITVAIRQRLGGAATQIFLEMLVASDRIRLRRAWDTLVGELAGLDAVPLMPVARHHAASAKELAAELGKEVDVIVEGPDLRVGVEVLDTIHTSLLHCLRNAVDHGIEPPSARVAAGKPRRGNVCVKVRAETDSVAVIVQDDGGGVDLESIRDRAAKLGLLSAEDALAAPEATLLDLTFAAGFSVRESAGTVSGRGIGLDAVRAGIERLGGRIGIASTRGVGAIVSFEVPSTRRVVEVHRLPSTQAGLSFAIPTTWTVRSGKSDSYLDPVTVLALRRNEQTTPTVGQIVVTRDGEEHGLVIGGPVSRVAATRIAPTSPDEPLEVVAFGGEHLLLLRPEVFFTARGP
ncbi:MAG: Hpt domain-containing protein [Labilithrix sp.]|nr:Hpt domain-containing protein [Labilithrix sp.]MCW5813003.1 Hpt domain-containing protein [Labilithrix sp.]